MSNQTASEQYKNAPLIETVFEIKFSGEPSIECHRDLFYKKIRDFFPTILVPNVNIGDAPSLSPYRFMDKNNMSGFLVSINSLAFTTKDYKGFFAFKETVLNYFNMFKKLYNINKINRTGLRYINIIPILRTDENILPIDTYLKVDINLPSPIPKQFKYFQTRFVTQTEGGMITTHIQPLTTPDKKNEIIILDFDYGKTGNLNYSNIEEYIEESHRNTKSFFESLVTDEYKSIMNGEVI